MLRGGVPCGSMTELVGPAGIGKSQLCLMLAASALLDPSLPANSHVRFTHCCIVQAHLSSRWFSHSVAATLLAGAHKRLSRFLAWPTAWATG